MENGMLSIGSCLLGNAPKVVAVIDELFSIEKILDVKQDGADIFEMRIDCYKAPLDTIVAYLEKVKNEAAVPMIGTVRENDWTSKDRIPIFRAIMPFVDSIDLELGTPISNEVRDFAHGKTIIVSEHDYNKTPSNDCLNDMVKRSLDQGADIVKLAVMANSRDDVRRLFTFTQECTIPVVTIAMGSHGTISRVIAPLFGSLFTYGFIEKPVAPGQLSAKKLVEEIGLYFA
ncbi:MAG: type I 3-dehydroquinate dehydratase [Fibrobacter sp.]|nr:type I 3-dehydroquinate dehydratase [Fibrobacter sp.]